MPMPMASVTMKIPVLENMMSVAFAMETALVRMNAIVRAMCLMRLAYAEGDALQMSMKMAFATQKKWEHTFIAERGPFGILWP
jgi:hypothetical protein